MCSRFVLVRKLEKLEARFNAKAVDGLKYKESFNISPGKASLIIAQDSPKLIKSAIFGLTPFWAKKPMYLINARAEGDKNKENDTNYKGAKDIIIKPAFRKPIRSNRCLILADAFIEGTSLEKLSKPFLIFMKDKIGAFAFAGIYDDWLNTKNGEYIRSFAIITSVANNLTRIIHKHNKICFFSRLVKGEYFPLEEIIFSMLFSRFLIPFNVILKNFQHKKTIFYRQSITFPLI